MKFIIIIIIVLKISIYSSGQSIDNLIQIIDTDYQSIVNNMDNYTKHVIDISKELYDNEEADETIRKKIITSYFDNNEIKLIAVYELTDHMYIEEYKTEYYIKNDSIFFIVKKEKEMQWEGYENMENRTTSITEKRFYFKSEKCIKYFEKSVEGKLSEIEDILRETSNEESNCPEIEISDEVIKIIQGK